jgi:acylphosphatase
LQPTDAVRAHVQVEGRVQGVFFRSDARDRAASLGLSGWVRNLRDGSVEAVFEGRKEAVESLLRWCERGPSGARVDHVEVRWQDPQGEKGFGIR